MNRTFGTHAPWALLDGFPLLLNLFSWGLLIAAIVIMSRSSKGGLVANLPAGKPVSKSARQTRVYKRGAALLLLLGAAGGFLPSLSLLARYGQVYSVNRVAPHTDVDASLMVHIPLAVIWAVAIAFQFWSGGNGNKIRQHRVGGWIAVGCGLLGLSLAAGWIWTYLNDFRYGITDPRAAPGFYTVTLGIGVAVNTVLLVMAAKKRNFMAHKDFALMALFWSMDPGIHRVIMWTMRMIDWECWAPENTGGMGIALAKLPANLFLILWALTLAAQAGRINRIILANVAVQLLLFTVSSRGLMMGSFGFPVATSVAVTTIILGLIALRYTSSRSALSAG
jgi:hypothetical protein